VDGWYKLHARFGRLEMERLLAPAAAAARDGFRVTPVIAGEWARDVDRIRGARHLLEGAVEYLSTYAPSGRAPEAGEIHTNPGLARTLDALAAGGRDAFYAGRVADTVADAVAGLGGLLTTADLAAHDSQWVTPISARYRGVDVFELPENDQGVTALQMLRLLDDTPLHTWGFGSADALHTMTECKKLAFEDRARFIADPEVSRSRTSILLSEERIGAMRSRIRPNAALSCAMARLPLAERGDTCYLTTADRDGMMVSLIQSNFLKTGSGVVPRGLGFALQNRGALFSLLPSHLNVLAPGKRPFHTIIPAFALLGGRPLLSFGVMGGAMQPQGHVQILTNLLDFDMDVEAAGRVPRWRHVGSSRPTGTLASDGGTLLCEPGFHAGVLDDLRTRGHRVEEKDEPGLFGGYQAIAVDSQAGDYVGATEVRKDGTVQGY
jgi:gamma-glutamyltranspeptidase/glutathione hydrolase